MLYPEEALRVSLHAEEEVQQPIPPTCRKLCRSSQRPASRVLGGLRAPCFSPGFVWRDHFSRACCIAASQTIHRYAPGSLIFHRAPSIPGWRCGLVNALVYGGGAPSVRPGRSVAGSGTPSICFRESSKANQSIMSAGGTTSCSTHDRCSRLILHHRWAGRGLPHDVQPRSIEDDELVPTQRMPFRAGKSPSAACTMPQPYRIDRRLCAPRRAADRRPIVLRCCRTPTRTIVRRVMV
ncbi:hypothetical protein FKP32DRAFT_626816 [Trametes sanguinea]|nr:hypothetical protein FKP32DRAFT_626816 [Trametes sanguinea]